MRLSMFALVLAPSLACSFDATGNVSASAASGPGESTGTPGASTGDEPPVPTSGGPDTSMTSMTSMTTMTTPTTVDPDPSTGGETGPVDPDTTASTVDDSSSGAEDSSSGPPPPGCGNMHLEDGEECDDGNADDSDACTSACKNAVCGDGHVQKNVEMCDDGNADESDGCTSACVPPTCEDGAKNGAETDTDCGGGMCKKCDVTLMCGTGTDCATGFCDGVCIHAPTCKALKSMGAPSGTSTIDPDGTGAGAPFDVYCEQDQSGGGWTLVIKADGSKNTFPYADAKWTDPNPYMADPTLDRKETKLQSFATVPVDEVLLGMEAPLGQGALQLKYIQFNLDPNPPSLASVFMAGTYVATNNPESQWTDLVTGGGLQDNCKRQGFNATSTANDPTTHARVRIGILGNDNMDCASPNSFIGVGASPDGDICDGGYGATTGNGAVCFVDGGKRDIDGFAVVYVR